ncbi:unnamed protein product [Citrullus colocynthis]|uniref:Uncharacterized protein n=1 Tax=Citrullus colocynthis TaxID=252529 RepID=A0ABP0YYQ2_9ROSI
MDRGSKAATRSGIRGTEAEDVSRQKRRRPVTTAAEVIGGSSRAKRDLGVTEMVDALENGDSATLVAMDQWWLMGQ